MRPFSDNEFTLVTQCPAAEWQETLRLLRLLGRLTRKIPLKADDRSFSYDFPNKMMSRIYVTGTVEPYEAPYTGCRITVRVSEGALSNIANIIGFFVLNPFLIMVTLLEAEFGFFAFFVFLEALAMWHWFCNVVPAMKRTQELIGEIFHATPEAPQPVMRDEA